MRKHAGRKKLNELFTGHTAQRANRYDQKALSEKTCHPQQYHKMESVMKPATTMEINMGANGPRLSEPRWR